MMLCHSCNDWLTTRFYIETPTGATSDASFGTARCHVGCCHYWRTQGDWNRGLCFSWLLPTNRLPASREINDAKMLI